MEENKLFDNRAVIRKLAEFNPDFKFFVVAPNGKEEITMYGVSEENFEITENSVVINLSKSLIQEITPEKEEEEDDKEETEEVTEEKKTRKNKKEEKVAEEPETVPEKEEAVADEGDSEDSDPSDE